MTDGFVAHMREGGAEVDVTVWGGFPSRSGGSFRRGNWWENVPFSQGRSP